MPVVSAAKITAMIASWAMGAAGAGQRELGRGVGRAGCASGAGPRRGESWARVEKERVGLIWVLGWVFLFYFYFLSLILFPIQTQLKLYLFEFKFKI